jgi:hypothetical protein
MTAIMTTTSTPPTHRSTSLPLHGGNVYFPMPADDQAQPAPEPLSLPETIVATLIMLAALGVFVGGAALALGLNWSHLVALLP